MTKDSVKIFFNKAWLLIKKYWYLFTLAIVIFVLMFVFRTAENKKVIDKILGYWFKAIERNDQSLRDLDTVRTTGNNNEGKIRSQYANDQVNLNNHYNTTTQEIKKQGSANAAQIANETKDNPDAMVEAFGEAFGIPRKE